MGTFRVRATAPGNVAEDGDAKSANGLHTKYLLEELKKPTAVIEDVFKRVRLNVRKQSQGRQILWESTSLEDDFFFNAGLRPTQKLSDSEKDKAFTTEKADWDKIKDSKNVDDFYSFLKTALSTAISMVLRSQNWNNYKNHKPWSCPTSKVESWSAYLMCTDLATPMNLRSRMD